MKREAVAQAIAAIEESRQSHAAWVDHPEDCAACRAAAPWQLVGSSEHHRACIAKYDHVLAVLRSIRVDDPADEPERLLCLRCSQWTPADDSLTACPNCGARGVPASSRDVVDVRITWHELRCLVIWAENWANAHRDKPDCETMPCVVYGIADRLMAQHLDRKTGLTLASEIAELRAAFGPNNVETNIPEPPDPEAR